MFSSIWQTVPHIGTLINTVFESLGDYLMFYHCSETFVKSQRMFHFEYEWYTRSVEWGCINGFLWFLNTGMFPNT